MSDEPPPLVVRWLHPQTASAYLELPTAPITLAAQKVIPWQAFAAEESAACEAAWQALSEEEKRLSEKCTAEGEGDPNEEIEEEIVGVSIARDKLFEVDVRRMQLRPIYWKMNAPPIKVVRALWMYDEHKPVSRDTSLKLEEVYARTKPWLPSYGLELARALELGAQAHAKLKLSLDENSSVIFESSDRARIISATTSKGFFSAFMSGSSNTLPAYYPYSTVAYRGYDAAVAAQEPSSRTDAVSTADAATKDKPEAADDVRINPLQQEHGVKQADANRPRKRDSMREWEPSPSPVGNESIENVTDLVLMIHGIGQGLATRYEEFNFVYAANLFRQMARKQAATPALASVMRSRRVQFLPVRWRTSFNIDCDEEQRRESEGLDNEFTLSDITVKNSVVYIRELVNNVLIDIPYFMSHHRQRMIEAVATEANRIYRLWCARNSGFERTGRVHIIAHSLGASLAAHILSNQPTTQPRLSDMKDDYVKLCKEIFLFNTSTLFLLGSPLSVFFHINRSQIIARKGRERTAKSPPDEALDRVGTFGCLAVDSIYNIFHSVDPVAYLLNPCVDAKRAKELPPSTIRNVNTPLFTQFSSRMSKVFNGISMPSSTSPGSRSPSRPAEVTRNASGYELGGQDEVLLGTKEERRFAALNPHGTLDFVLPSEGTIGGYVDMITAHSSYWSNPNMAAFVLAEIFGRKEDLARTGLGLESAGPHTA